MPIDRPDSLKLDDEPRLKIADHRPCCEICAMDHWDHVPAVAIAPQSEDGNHFRWVGVCRAHLLDWYKGCKSYPRPYMLAQWAPIEE